MKAPESEATLLLKARSGNTEAFGELIRRYQRQVWLVCRQYVGPGDADEACQEAFIKAFTRLASFDGRAKFSTWLIRIAINTSIDLLRKEQRRPIAEIPPEHDVLPDESAGPDELSRQRETVSRLMDEIKALPEGQRRVFRLRFFAHLELEEIAGVLGVHPGTVKTQLYRAVHRLRRKLEDFR